MHKVKLTYYKSSGKFYSEGEYESSKEYLFEIWHEVRTMLEEENLPGLIKGHSQYIVQVEVPGHLYEHPHIVIPEIWRHYDA